MGFRFRKSIKIMPGVRVNMGLRGGSVTLGGRGASVNIGKRGINARYSIPGTGISYSERIYRQSTRRVSAPPALRESTSVEITIKLNEETGQIEFSGSSAQYSGKKLAKIAWEQKSREIAELLQEYIEKLQDETALLTEIYLESPNPTSWGKTVYESKRFAEAAPQKPEPAISPEQPVLVLRPLKWYHKLIPGGIERLEKRNKTIQKTFKEAHENWEQIRRDSAKKYRKEVDQYLVDLKIWAGLKDEHDKKEAILKVDFDKSIRGNPGVMLQYLENQIADAEWPRETLVSFDFGNDLAQVYVDIDLPEIENVPTKTASLSANGRRLLVKEKTKKQAKEEYSLHVHGILMRVSGIVFKALPGVNVVIASGYTQRVNKATGHINDDYILSAKILRTDYARLNFSNLKNVNPVDFISQGEHRRKLLQSGEFKTIEPFEMI
ncbi:MAG: DUF4236 domain-containing protein [Cellvibrionaceae bacterium]|nr:DUF4236 domain-containing protein [Cellvibrionaceae bacterium]